MSVLMCKQARLSVMASFMMATRMQLIVFSGALPTNIAGKSYTDLLNVDRVADKLAVYGSGYYGACMTTVETADEMGWEMSATSVVDAAYEGANGTIGWFLYRYVAGQHYDYWISDSVSITGGNGIAQFSSMSIVDGQPLPALTDFALKVA